VIAKSTNKNRGHRLGARDEILERRMEAQDMKILRFL
jgi:hypothetical protein